MHKRALFFSMCCLLLASFLASFMQDTSLTGEAIRSMRTSFSPTKQPLSLQTSPAKDKVIASFSSLLLQQFPSLSPTTLATPQKITGSSILRTRLHCPWESQSCITTVPSTRGIYTMNAAGLQTCIQDSLTACRNAPKSSTTTQVKSCLTRAEQSCKQSNTNTPDRIPEKFCAFQQTSDITTSPCFLSSVITEGDGQLCTVTFTNQGAVESSIRCQPSSQTESLHLSCVSSYTVSAAHACRIDSIIKPKPGRLSY